VASTYLPRQRHLDAPFLPARHLGDKTYLGANPKGPNISLRCPGG